jgi:hypothetical protein
MKAQQIAEFIRLWKQAAVATKAANEIKDEIRDEAVKAFFGGRDGDPDGKDTLCIESDAGTVLVSFTRSYRALDESERDKAAEIVGPVVRKHFRPSWRVEADGLTEAQAKAVQELVGAKCSATKVYTASDAWHSDRHTLVVGEKLAELEQALKIERVSVSVAKGGAA